MCVRKCYAVSTERCTWARKWLDVHVNTFNVGHTRQGLKCRLCKMNVHLDCQEKVTNRCQTKSRLLRRQKSTSEIETRLAGTMPEEEGMYLCTTLACEFCVFSRYYMRYTRHIFGFVYSAETACTFVRNLTSSYRIFGLLSWRLMVSIGLGCNRK